MTLSFKNPAKVALAIGALAAALALAACGGDEGEDSSSAGAAAGGAASEVASIESVDGTDVLVDSEGRTLYTADVEEGGMIECIGACTSIWEPASASAEQARTASSDLGLDLAAVRRPDGEQQLALDGAPLYSFTEEGPGELTGDGFVDDFQGTQFSWQVAAAGDGSGSPDSAPSDSSGGSIY